MDFSITAVCAKLKSLKPKSTPRTALSATAAALASLAAMLGCCLPLPAVLAAGSLGAVAGWLPSARPYLLAASFASLGFAFYRLYHRRFCELKRPWWTQALLWFSLTAVLAAAWFPQWTANLLAGSPVAVARPRARGHQVPLQVFRDLAPLRESFNASIERTRILALLSPT